MALLLLTVVRGDLLRNWRASLPPDAPNAFLINVLPDQVDGVRALLQARAHVDATLRPMVRGRLVEVNGAPFATAQFGDERARRLGEREFNLSWSDALPAGNRVVAGSVVEARGNRRRRRGLARRGHRQDAGAQARRHADLRHRRHARQREGNEPAQSRLGQLPRQFLCPVRAGRRSTRCPRPTSRQCARTRAMQAWLTALVHEYPNVLVIDVGEILAEVQSIMDQVALAVEFVFLFTLLGGVLVLEAAIATTQDERRYDAAVLRTLGASERQLSAAQIAEFLALGALAGCSRRPARRRPAMRLPIASSTYRSLGIRALAHRHRGFGGLRRGRRMAWDTQHAASAAAGGAARIDLTAPDPPSPFSPQALRHADRARPALSVDTVQAGFLYCISHPATHRPWRKTLSSPASSPILGPAELRRLFASRPAAVGAAATVRHRGAAAAARRDAVHHSASDLRAVDEADDSRAQGGDSPRAVPTSSPRASRSSPGSSSSRSSSSSNGRCSKR